MLYDPNWKKEVENKPSLEGFIAFLKTKNPRDRYDFTHPATCALAQYLKSINYTGCIIIPSERINHLFGGGLDVNLKVLNPRIGAYTFGAALRRMEDLCSSRSKRMVRR